jgi:predicted peptidase
MLNYWKMIVATMALSWIAAGSLHADDVTTVETGQHAQKLEKQVTIKLDYLLYLPPQYEKDTKKTWPLILFLHGSGERGSDVNKVKVHGPPKIVESKPDSILAKEFIVVSPQCPAGRGWKADDLIVLLDDVEAKYRVNADKVYLTGLSMGGFGTWDLAANFPDRFAAIAPMCGGGQPEMARRLKHTPIWVFHGDADPAVPVKRSDDMVEALKKLDADVKYTRYPGVGHDCWSESYANPELYTWFLSHELPKPGEKPGGKVKNEK